MKYVHDTFINNDLENELESEIDNFYLFESDWNGNAIKDLKSSHLINILLKLERDAEKIKLSYVLYLLDNNYLNNIAENIFKETIKMDSLEWVTSTPIYKIIKYELKRRRVWKYFIDIKNNKNK